MSKHEDPSTILLKHHLKALKLPTMLSECEKTAARCAKENVDHLRLLLQLCELELLDRERRAAERRLTGATLDRLTHRCHILEARGDSHRLREAKRRRGQTKAPPQEGSSAESDEDCT